MRARGKELDINSSRTGVSIATAPWRAKQAVMVAKAASRIRIWSGSRSRAPFAILGFLRTCGHSSNRAYVTTIATWDAHA